jgi:metal-responsive CopG/Arc/MetJ family transcriptional regulator
MGTEHPKVTAYIPQVILEALDNWKKEAGIESRSAAIVEILADYLGVPYPVEQKGNVPTGRINDLLNTIVIEMTKQAMKVTALQERVTALEAPMKSDSTAPNAVPSAAFDSTSDKISNIPGEVLSTAPSTASNSTTPPASDVSYEAPSTVPRQSTSPANTARGEVPSSAPTPTLSPEPLSQTTLATRLGISDKAVQKQRGKGKESFAAWSRERDPDNVAWTWEGSGGRGQPLQFVPLVSENS